VWRILQGGVPLHRERMQWSFVVALNSSRQYEGGGTKFVGELPLCTNTRSVSECTRRILQSVSNHTNDSGEALLLNVSQCMSPTIIQHTTHRTCTLRCATQTPPIHSACASHSEGRGDAELEGAPVFRPKVGRATMFSGKNRHCGVAITAGEPSDATLSVRYAI
jgi:hypothetical protein